MSAKKQRPDPPQLPEQDPCPFPMGESERGAMTDASKRRFDPESEAGLDDEFEMVTSGMVAGNVYDPNDLQIDLATMIAEAPYPSPAPCYGIAPEKSCGFLRHRPGGKWPGRVFGSRANLTRELDPMEVLRNSLFSFCLNS